MSVRTPVPERMDTRTPGGRGFSLAEVLVAVVVLELGLLGALSLVVLAARTVQEARSLESSAAVASDLADSLAAADRVLPGTGLRGGRAARWAPDADGFVVRVQIEGDDSMEVRGVSERSLH